jgi:integrase
VTLDTFRHSHASALHYRGWTPTGAARRLGHSGEVHMRIYAHVIDSLENRQRYTSLDELVAEARAPRKDTSTSS